MNEQQMCLLIKQYYEGLYLMILTEVNTASAMLNSLLNSINFVKAMFQKDLDILLGKLVEMVPEINAEVPDGVKETLANPCFAPFLSKGILKIIDAAESLRDLPKNMIIEEIGKQRIFLEEQLDILCSGPMGMVANAISKYNTFVQDNILANLLILDEKYECLSTVCGIYVEDYSSDLRELLNLNSRGVFKTSKIDETVEDPETADQLMAVSLGIEEISIKIRTLGMPSEEDPEGFIDPIGDWF